MWLIMIYYWNSVINRELKTALSCHKWHFLVKGFVSICPLFTFKTHHLGACCWCFQQRAWESFAQVIISLKCRIVTFSMTCDSQLQAYIRSYFHIWIRPEMDLRKSNSMCFFLLTRFFKHIWSVLCQRTKLQFYHLNPVM